MKKIFTVFALVLGLFTFSNTEATILTVSNVAGQAAMYTDVQPAVNSAAVGDTVFVHASGTAYGEVLIQKRIVLLGEGGKPQYNKLASTVGRLTIDTLVGPAQPVSGTVVNGIYVNFYAYINSNLKNVVIKNCRIAYPFAITGSGHVIVNNYFNSNVSGGSNLIFMGNFVSSDLYGITNWTIANNVFNSTIYNVTSSSVVNNIFLGASAIGAGNVSNSFSKNLQVGSDLPIGNYTSQVLFSTFTETVSVNMQGDDLFTKTFTYKAGSPGIAGGTDGKDVGIHGGQYPWPAGTYLNGDPGLPKVQSIEVQNAVLAPGATLKVNLKAKSASTKK